MHDSFFKKSKQTSTGKQNKGVRGIKIWYLIDMEIDRYRAG